MTDKVIIDGVDVSECEYFNGLDNAPWGISCSCDMTKTTDCSKNNCNYKQLQLSEAKCLELNLQIIELEKQCKELVEKIKNYRLEPSERIDFNRYKQALDKIKEIVTQDYVELNDIIKIINEVRDEQ